MTDAAALLRAGADKVSVNTAALERPALISELADVLGSQAVVVAIDAAEGEARARAGTEPTGRLAVAWAREAEARGAGDHFFSRSRNRLWLKGETSGNTLEVEEVREDCDGDAILLRVRPTGAVCHTGSTSCFAPWLWRLVAERAASRPDGSYVTAMLEQGPAAAARKVGEEGLEAALAGAGESDERVISELADLWFHSYLLLAARGLDPADVEQELEHRRR